MVIAISKTFILLMFHIISGKFYLIHILSYLFRVKSNAYLNLHQRCLDLLSLQYPIWQLLHRLKGQLLLLSQHHYI